MRVMVVGVLVLMGEFSRRLVGGCGWGAGRGGRCRRGSERGRSGAGREDASRRVVSDGDPVRVCARLASPGDLPCLRTQHAGTGRPLAPRRSNAGRTTTDFGDDFVQVRRAIHVVDLRLLLAGRHVTGFVRTWVADRQRFRLTFARMVPPGHRRTLHAFPNNAGRSGRSSDSSRGSRRGRGRRRSGISGIGSPGCSGPGRASHAYSR